MLLASAGVAYGQGRARSILGLRPMGRGRGRTTIGLWVRVGIGILGRVG